MLDYSDRRARPGAGRRSADVARGWLRAPAAGAPAGRPRHPRRVRRLPARGHQLGAPADVRGLRQRRLLRLLTGAHASAHFDEDGPRGDALGRARRGLALVLRGPPDRVSRRLSHADHEVRARVRETRARRPGGRPGPRRVHRARGRRRRHGGADHARARRPLRAGPPAPYDAPVYTIGAVADQDPRGRPRRRRAGHRRRPGETLDVGAARPGGRREARRDPPRDARASTTAATSSRARGQADLPPGRLAHPAPGPDVDLLLLPVSAPLAEGRARPSTSVATSARRRSLAIHDKVYSDVGLSMVDAHLTRMLGEREQAFVASPTAPTSDGTVEDARQG